MSTSLIFWIFMTVCNLLIPLTMIIFGGMLAKNPPQMNSFFGYRTAMSYKSRATWNYAHKHFGRAWKKWGLWMLVGTVPLMLFCHGKNEGQIGLYGGFVCLIECLVMIIPVILTERELKKQFDEDGNRKIYV